MKCINISKILLVGLWPPMANPQNWQKISGFVFILLKELCLIVIKKLNTSSYPRGSSLKRGNAPVPQITLSSLF